MICLFKIFLNLIIFPHLKACRTIYITFHAFARSRIGFIPYQFFLASYLATCCDNLFCYTCNVTMCFVKHLTKCISLSSYGYNLNMWFVKHIPTRIGNSIYSFIHACYFFSNCTRNHAITCL